MPALDESKALSALGMSLAGTQFYYAALPPLFEIRKNPDQYSATDIREGEKFATVATLGLGVMVAAMLDSKTPLIMAGIVSAVMVGMYEWQISRQAGQGILSEES